MFLASLKVHAIKSKLRKIYLFLVGNQVYPQTIQSPSLILFSCIRIVIKSAKECWHRCFICNCSPNTSCPSLDKQNPWLLCLCRDLNSKLIRYSNGPKQFVHQMVRYSSHVSRIELIVCYSNGKKFGNQIAFGH